MGFLSKLKNNVMGSWADVTLTVAGSARVGEPLDVHVDVVVKDEGIEVGSVLVELTCDEVIDAGAVLRKAATSGTTTTGYSNEVSEQLGSAEVAVAGSTQLAAGSTTGFDGSITIPAGAPASARGRHAEFRWTIRARLDMKGNDPDSGWQPLDVRS